LAEKTMEKKLYGNISFVDAKKWGLQEVEELELKPGIEFVLSEFKSWGEEYTRCHYFKILKQVKALNRQKDLFLLEIIFSTGHKEEVYTDVIKTLHRAAKLDFIIYYGKIRNSSTSFRPGVILIPSN